MKPVTLYQFELCPYCHKVRAGLEAKGIPFKKVEVNPMNKKELPELEAEGRKKVPVLEFEGEIVRDSTDILAWMEARFPERTPFLAGDTARKEKAEMIERWVDEDLTQILPTVIYGTWGEAVRAAQVTARTSNFGLVQNMAVRVGGSLIMHQVAKRILKKRGEGKSAKELLDGELDRLEAWLGDQDFLCGDTISLGDVAAHGALTCILDFPAFSFVRERPKLLAWYDRVAALRAQNRAA